MKVTIRDTEVLRLLAPTDILGYLSSLGWQQSSLTQNHAVLTKVDPINGEFEVDVPLQESYRDYHLGIARLLDTLEVVEDRSQLDILRDISTSTVDVLRILPDIETQNDGSIPLLFAESLIIHTKDLYLAAACSAVKPSGLFAGRRPAGAEEYLKRIRFGQTERGSFVLAIHSSVTPVLAGQLALTNLELPFQRKVTMTLTRALDALKRAAIKGSVDRSVNAFVESVPLGISANLCDAIANLQKNTEAKSISFKMTWARVRPPEANAIGFIKIDREDVPWIEEASRYFHATIPVPETDIEGVPVVLNREGNTEQGIITVPTYIDGKARRVRLQLQRADYERAVDAHRRGWIVRATGILAKNGRSFELQNFHDVQIIQEDE